MENELMTCNPQPENEGGRFVEFRRKVRSAEVLSTTMEQLLRMLQFTGKLSVVVQNGRVLKSGYEEGYFRKPPLT
jgi:sulfur carrier protein ThiS